MNKIKKIVAGLTMFGLMVTALPVGATTIEELEAKIAELEALVAQLEAALAAPSAPAPTTPVSVACTFTRNLYPGMSGADVLCLQQYLNAAGFKVAETGAGSPGNETQYFGPRTQAAVQAWQDAHGVAYGAYPGYFGPISRAKFSEIGTAPVTPPVTPPADDDDDVDDVDDTPGVEGVLNIRNLPLPSGVEVGPNSSNVAVAGLQIRAEDSNIRVQRIDLTFTHASTTVLRNAVSHVALYEGNNALQGVTLTRDTVTTSAGATTSIVRFAPLNVLVPKDGSKDIVVHVTIPNNPAIVSTSETITVGVGLNDVRGLDGAGIHQYNTGTVSRTFVIDEALDSGKLTISRHAETPAQGVILADQDNTTPDQELLKFNLKAENQGATVEEVTVTLTDTSSTVAYLMLYDGTTLLATEIAGATVNFQNLEVNIAKGTTKTLRVVAEFGKIDDSMEGATVLASIASATHVSGYDDADNDLSVTGDATGEAQLVYSVVPLFTLADRNIAVASDGKSASGYVEFKVKALGGRLRVSATTSASITVFEGPADYTNATSSRGTVEVTGMTASGGWYTFEENQEATFNVPVAFTAHSGQSQWVRVAVKTFVWQLDNDGWTSDVTWSGDLVEALRTIQVMISN